MNNKSLKLIKKKNFQLISTPEDYKKLEIGTKLYNPTESKVEYFTFLGFNPYKSCSNYIMLMSSYDVTKITGHYITKDHPIYFMTNYEEACNILYANSIINQKNVKKIFLRSHKVLISDSDIENI